MTSKAETILRRMKRDRKTLIRDLIQGQSSNATAPPDNVESPLLKELSEWQDMENKALKRTVE